MLNRKSQEESRGVSSEGIWWGGVDHLSVRVVDQQEIFLVKRFDGTYKK